MIFRHPYHMKSAGRALGFMAIFLTLAAVPGLGARG